VYVLSFARSDRRAQFRSHIADPPAFLQQIAINLTRDFAGPRGLRGGGGLAILAFFASATVAAWLRATPGGDQLEAMFGDISLDGTSMLPSRSSRRASRDRYRLCLAGDCVPPFAGHELSGSLRRLWVGLRFYRCPAIIATPTA
jgi:hypothetical protein